MQTGIEGHSATIMPVSSRSRVTSSFTAGMLTETDHSCNHPPGIVSRLGIGRVQSFVRMDNRERSVPMQAQFQDGRGLHFLEPQFRVLSERSC